MNEKAKPTVRVKLVRSLAGRSERQIACARGLGLNKIGSSRELVDTPQLRGMIRKIEFLLEVK